MRGARLHPRRARDGLGTCFDGDQNPNRSSHRRMPIRCNANGCSAAALRFIECAKDVRRGARSRDADDRVAPRNMPHRKIARTACRGILRPFDSLRQSRFSAGDDRLYAARRNSVSWREFRGIERGEPAAGSRAHVKYAPARGQRPHDRLCCPHNRRHFARDSPGNRGIFAIDRPQNVARGMQIEPARARIALFGRRDL